MEKHNHNILVEWQDKETESSVLLSVAIEQNSQIRKYEL
jgi:hypothetical protein